MRSIIDKRGQVGSMGPAVIALVIAAVFLILGLVMLQSFRDTDAVKQSQSASVVNETATTVNEVAQSLGGVSMPGSNSFVVTQVFNQSNHVVIPASNYTYSSTAGTILYKPNQGDPSGFNNTNWKVTYSYKHGGEAFKNTNTTLIGLSNFSDYWEIIVLAVVITVVIGLLLIVFAGRNNR